MSAEKQSEGKEGRAGTDGQAESGDTGARGKQRYREARAQNSPEEGAQADADFQSFLAGLYTQTLASLGAVEDPSTGEPHQDLQQARYLIDTLGLLKEKTEGNLESSEEGYFMNLLQDLRMRYVQAVENKQSEGDESASTE